MLRTAGKNQLLAALHGEARGGVGGEGRAEWGGVEWGGYIVGVFEGGC